MKPVIGGVQITVFILNIQTYRSEQCSSSQITTYNVRYSSNNILDKSTVSIKDLYKV